MKILFVLENYLPNIGGVEVVFKNLMEGLAKKHDVTLITQQLPGTKNIETINGVKVYRIKSPNRYLFPFLAMPKILRTGRKADLIHATTFTSAPAAWLGAKLLGKKVILTVHEIWIGKWKEFTEENRLNCLLHDMLERMIYLLPFDKYACVSNSTRKQVLKAVKKENKVVTVYNPMDYEFWNPAKYGREMRKKLGIEKNFVCLYYGRPGRSKGLEYLIKAIPLLKIKDMKLMLILSKDKENKKRYEQTLKLIRKLKIEDKTILIEPQPYKELPKYIKAADCIIVPSLTEGFGYTCHEACTMQVPVVASNTASLPEVACNRFVLVKPKSPEAIAEGIQTVKDGKYEKTPQKHFTREKNLQGYLKVYKEAMQRKGYG